MIFRLEVGLKREMTDPEGKALLKRIESDFGLKTLNSIRVLRTYLFDIKNGSIELIENFAKNVVCDPVTEYYSVGEYEPSEQFDWIVETGFLPGVTDNESRTAMWALKTFSKMEFDPEDNIFSGKKYLFYGEIDHNAIELVVSGLLINKLIQRFTLISGTEWRNGKKVGNKIPKVIAGTKPKTEIININVEDKELDNISKSRILALSIEEMKAVKAYYSNERTKETRKKKGFSENPTDCEIEVIAQTWSEHCKHKIFSADVNYTDTTTGEKKEIKSLYKSYVQRVTKELAPEKSWLKSVFTDNAGIIEIDKDNLFAMKVETHNSPSALDPYGGALTGIVGVNRDIIGCGMGAKPILNTDVFCFASPFFSGELPGTNLLHPARIFRGVHRGVKDGGNESGIPVVNGSIFFDNRFIGKPLVFCGTGGLMPKEVNNNPSHVKKAQKGDLIIMTGGRVGKDGIHGATFSSEELHEGSPVTAVQIGDAFTQKKMLDFIIEARDSGLFRSITDNGAGGLSSSVGEMAEDTNGAVVFLEKVPLKYSGLNPWEIFISEAQERMTLAVAPEKMEKLYALAKIHEVEISVIGEFRNTGYLEIFYDKEPVALLDMDFLHNGLPKYKLDAVWERKENNSFYPEEYDNYDAILCDMVSRLNIASKEKWVRQYDHEVQGRSAVKPFCGKDHDGPSDAAVVRLSPFTKTAIVASHGINPTISDIDAYWMTASVIDEALRNAVAVGADPDFISGLDNFCWPDPVYNAEKNPDGKDKMAALVRSNLALYDICKAYSLPLISGKDSMKNDYGSGKNKISVPPTLLFTLISRMDNVENAVTMDFKKAGDIVYVIGETANEMGSSEYYAYHGERKSGYAPRVYPEKFMASYKKLHQAIHKGLIASAHDISDGGLAVTVSESAFSGDLGVRVDLSKVPLRERIERNDIVLFSESNGRIVVSVHEENREEFEKMMEGIQYSEIGEVTSGKFVKISGIKGNVILNISAATLKEWWQKPLNLKLN